MIASQISFSSSFSEVNASITVSIGSVNPPKGTSSHASPSPSESLSNWSGFAVLGQLSTASAIPSLSESHTSTA